MSSNFTRSGRAAAIRPHSCRRAAARETQAIPRLSKAGMPSHSEGWAVCSRREYRLRRRHYRMLKIMALCDLPDPLRQKSTETRGPAEYRGLLFVAGNSSQPDKTIPWRAILFTDGQDHFLENMISSWRHVEFGEHEPLPEGAVRLHKTTTWAANSPPFKRRTAFKILTICARSEPNVDNKNAQHLLF